MTETKEVPPLTHMAQQQARDICDRYPHKPNVDELLADQQTPEELFGLLVSNGLYPEAAQFWANALPQREAVWWACLSAREAYGEETPAKAAAALAAAESWVTDPTELHRRATEPAARAAGGLSSPAGCAAQAAFWSGGSLAAVGQPVIAPDDTLTAAAVLAAIIRAALLMGPLTFQENIAALLYLGFEVAAGSRHWPTPASSPAPVAAGV